MGKMAMFRKDKKIPYRRDFFLKEVINCFSCRSKTSRVNGISFVKNLHLQAQLLCELPVVSVLALQLFTLLGKEYNAFDLYNHFILQHL